MITQPLRDEHQDLLPQVELLRIAGDAVAGTEMNNESRQAVMSAYNFLAHHLIPHALAEDKGLYPEVQKVIGSREATVTMSRDHDEVGKLTAQLKKLLPDLENEKLSPDRSRELRIILYGLYSLVRVHFAKEEEIFLPLLDASLNQDEADTMFLNMEAAAEEAKKMAFK